MKFRKLALLPIFSSVLTTPVSADSFWTGEVDGNVSTDLNWQSDTAPALVDESLYFAGDNLLGNSVTAINYNLLGSTYNRIAFNYIDSVQHSALINNFSLTGEVLTFSGSNSVLTSAAGTVSITNNIQADQLSVSNGSSGSLTLDGSITMTGGSYSKSSDFTGEYFTTYRDSNLSFTTYDSGSLVINGDINDIPLSPTRDALDFRNRLVSFSGTGVQFNGNLDIYTDYAASSVEMLGSTLNGSVASNEFWSNSAIVNGTVQTADFAATGNTTVTGSINLDDHSTYTLVDTSNPEQVDSFNDNVDGSFIASKVSVLANANDGSTGSLTLVGGGVITTSNLESAATLAPLNVFAPRIELHDGRLILDNSGQAVTDRIADNIDVHFGTGGVLALAGHATTAVNENIGQLVVGADHIRRSGGSTAFFDDSAAHGAASIELSQNSSLTASELSISDGRWLDVSSASGSVGGALASDPKLMISTAPSLISGLVDGVIINRQEFATYDMVNGVVSATSPDNVRFDTATSLPVTGAPQVLNSLALNFDGQLGGSDAIELTSERLLVNGNVDISPSVDFGAQQGRVYAFGDVDFSGGAVANNGLQVSGDQESVYVNQSTPVTTRTVTFSGGVALNGALGIDSATVQLAAGHSANLTGGLLNNSVLENAGTIVNTGHLDAQGDNRIVNSGSFINDGGDFGYVSGVSNHFSYSGLFENSGDLT